MSPAWPIRLGSILVLLLHASGGAAQAQADTTRTRPTGLSSHALFAIGAGASLAAMTLDDQVRSWVQDPGVQAHSGLGTASSVFRTPGEPYVAGIFAVATVAAWSLGREEAAAAGLHVTETVLAGALFSAGVKSVVGRARPHASPDPWQYDLGAGFESRDFRSLPSGHTTQAFAIAAALSSELEHHLGVRTRWVPATAFGLASLTAMSRVYDDRHWLSDTIAGATLGLLANRITARLNHR